MAEKIVRLGYVGLAIEATPGSAEPTPDIFIPYIENSLQGHHEPLKDLSARASRVAQYGSVAGKKWGEGSLKMYLDSSNAGYLLKMAFGSESNTLQNTTPPVYDHLMYPTVSGNNVTSATLWDYRGFDVEQYTYMAADVTEIEVTTEGIATISTSMMGKAPTTVTAPALTTASGTLYTWKDMNVYFGTTTVAALAASPTKLTQFKATISNNVSLNYKSGSQGPDTVTTKQLEVTGSYALYFESATDRDNYMNLVKQSMVVRLTGANLGAGFGEKIDFVFRKVRIDSISRSTGLDDLFLITCTFAAEMDQAQAGFVEATVRNGKSSVYA